MAAEQTRPRQALVFGASGVSGHAILKQLLSYPTATEFSRIIGLTNRPLNKSVAQLPDDHRLELYADLDLMSRDKTLFQMQRIPGIKETTHIYFTAYTGHGSEYQELKKVNVEMLVNAVGTCEICCPEMEFMTLQTGGKAYGVEFADKPEVSYNPPLSESLPRIPKPHADNIFYYEQHDVMARACEGKKWTFCEIRPDAIVGFVPQNNAMNIAQALGLFLSFYAGVEGEGTELPFPGSEKAWTSLHTDTSSDILARFHIFASLRPGDVSGRAFNVVDGPATTWQAVWPEICDYFHLRGTAPTALRRFDVHKWMEERRGQWGQWVQKHGLKEGALEATGFDFAHAIMNIPFRRDYDASASRKLGFTEERAHAEGYKIAFDEMRRARIIP